MSKIGYVFGELRMDDLTLILAIVIFVFVLVIIFTFFRRISEIDNESKKAKNVVSDFTLNFSEKTQKQESEIRLLYESAGNLSLERKKLLNKLEKAKEEIAKDTTDSERIGQLPSKVMAEVKSIEDEIEQVAKTQKTIEQKLEKIEKIPTRVQGKRSMQKRTIPISLGRDRALAPLTDCQIEILKILAAEGEKTAPEMRERIGITREHTSRLMRRLYDEGYVERDMRKMPYIYRIKEEARDLLKE